MPFDPQFNQIFQAMPAPSILLLPDAPKFTIVAVNNTYLEVVNSAEKDLIGKGIFEAFPENPEDRVSKGVENLTNSLNFVIAQEETHKMPFQKYDIPIRGTSKFKVKYFNPQNFPIKDDNNNITYILHSVEDVTDKTRLELSLEIERKRFNDLYYQAPSCMGILKGPEHVYELANPLYLELIGVKDVIGKTVKEVLPEMEAQGILKILDTVYETGETFSATEMLFKFNHHRNGALVDRYLNFNYLANKNNEGTINGILVFATDVTELVLARKKTEESEKRYKELIQNLPIATVSSDFEGHILLYNKAAVDLWGREPDIGKDKWCGSWKLYCKDGNPIPNEMSPMAIAIKEGRKITPQEIIVERPNGVKVNVLINPVPYKDSSGKVIGIVNMGIDITESKKAERILRESESRYQLLIQEANDAIFVADASQKFIEVNFSGCQITGYTKEEFLRLSMNDLLFKEDLKANISIIEDLKNGKTIRYERRIKRKNGTSIELEFSGKMLDDGRFINIAHDITERKKAEYKLIQSEKRLNEAQEVAHLGSWELNFETGNSLWSKEACNIFGLTSTDNTLAHTYSNWLSFIHPEDIVEVLELIDESSKTLNDLILNYRIILKDGTIKFIYGKTKFEFDTNQKPVGLYGISLDITERKREEDKLKKLNKELANQNEEKEIRAAELYLSNKEFVKINKELDSFVYSVSHDLRSPLTSILGLISLIEEDSREPDTLEMVKMIRTSINRLDGFIKKILIYSKNNRTDLEPQKIPITKTINEIVDSIRNIKEARGISFEIDIDERQSFYSDWHRFNTVMENLVSNAIKYHTKEVPGRYLKLTGITSKEELKLTITDNGIGIDPEFHDKIFDMFYRLPGNTEGSGLGLYIVKETLEKMKGTIEIQSEKGVGTSFKIRLKNLEV